jgi:hypothetical protein
VVKRYFSYLLRLWGEGAGDTLVWRASLDDVSTGEHRAFKSIDRLVRYLYAHAWGGELPEAAGNSQERTPHEGADQSAADPDEKKR